MAKEALSKLEGPKAGHPGKRQQEERPKEKPLQGMLGDDVKESCVVEYDDECDERDYCVPEDEGATGKGDYVSLLDNPERFTGYSGPGARHVWNAIYRENCFLKPQQQSPSAPNDVFEKPLGSQYQAVEDFRHVLESHEINQVVSGAVRDELFPLDDECLEKTSIPPCNQRNACVYLHASLLGLFQPVYREMGSKHAMLQGEVTFSPRTYCQPLLQLWPSYPSRC